MDLTKLMRTLENKLSNEDFEKLNSMIVSHLEKSSGIETLLKDCIEKRFAEGLVCPHCGSTEVVKNGKTKGKQRYKCKHCPKTFSVFTKTVFADSKKPMTTWLAYAKCMGQEMTLRATAEKLGITLKTSFYMRHKILSAIRESMGIDELSGVIEMDETYFAESFKGNHKKGNSNWMAPRRSGKSRKRGKQVEYRGISKEQICISCAMDRNDNLVIVPACNGRPSTKDICNIYQDRVVPHSIICTDSHNAYCQFAVNVSATHIQIEKGKHKKGVYHINHINSMHNKLKKWMKRRYGVATKYIGNYMYWFNWAEKCKGNHHTSKDLIFDSISSIMILTREDIRKTTPFKFKEECI